MLKDKMKENGMLKNSDSLEKEIVDEGKSILGEGLHSRAGNSGSTGWVHLDRWKGENFRGRAGTKARVSILYSSMKTAGEQLHLLGMVPM